MCARRAETRENPHVFLPRSAFGGTGARCARRVIRCPFNKDANSGADVCVCWRRAIGNDRLRPGVSSRERAAYAMDSDT